MEIASFSIIRLPPCNLCANPGSEMVNPRAAACQIEWKSADHHAAALSLQARLPDLPPLGIGIKAAIAQRDPPPVGDMGSHPGDAIFHFS
jgi:hypothetical protein